MGRIHLFSGKSFKETRKTIVWGSGWRWFLRFLTPWSLWNLLEKSWKSCWKIDSKILWPKIHVNFLQRESAYIFSFYFIFLNSTEFQGWIFPHMATWKIWFHFNFLSYQIRSWKTKNKMQGLVNSSWDIFWIVNPEGSPVYATSYPLSLLKLFANLPPMSIPSLSVNFQVI